MVLKLLPPSLRLFPLLFPSFGLFVEWYRLILDLSLLTVTESKITVKGTIETLSYRYGVTECIKRWYQ